MGNGRNMLKGEADLKIVALNIGKITSMDCNGKAESTAIFKMPVKEKVWLTKTGFVGDEQADLKHHGGEDKAVCVYSYEHYAYWETVFGAPLPNAAFGENLTVQGMLESELHIGDIFQIGEALVQITQPRQPCYKLIARYGIKEFPIHMQDKGYTGFYLRVLKEGYIDGNSNITRVTLDENQISIDFANQMMHHDQQNFSEIKKILTVDALSANWRKTFMKRLEGENTDTSERLQGKS